MSFLSTLDNLRPTLKGDRGVALEYVVLFRNVTDIQTDGLKWNLRLKRWSPQYNGLQGLDTLMLLVIHVLLQGFCS